MQGYLCITLILVTCNGPRCAKGMEETSNPLVHGTARDAPAIHPAFLGPLDVTALSIGKLIEAQVCCMGLLQDSSRGRNALTTSAWSPEIASKSSAPILTSTSHVSGTDPAEAV